MRLPVCPECRALFEADVNLWNRTRTNEVRHGSWVAETRMLEELAEVHASHVREEAK